jgi:hypothetical protein
MYAQGAWEYEGMDGAPAASGKRWRRENDEALSVSHGGALSSLSVLDSGDTRHTQVRADAKQKKKRRSCSCRSLLLSLGRKIRNQSRC